VTACIGWDGPCVVYGQFHGCRYPENGHVNKPHRCECGAETTIRGGALNSIGPRRVAGCGTDSGYKRHRYLGEDACPQCKHAHSAYVQTGKARRKAS
jgi:hypothetical protein